MNEPHQLGERLTEILRRQAQLIHPPGPVSFALGEVGAEVALQRHPGVTRVEPRELPLGLVEPIALSRRREGSSTSLLEQEAGRAGDRLHPRSRHETLEQHQAAPLSLVGAGAREELSDVLKDVLPGQLLGLLWGRSVGGETSGASKVVAGACEERVVEELDEGIEGDFHASMRLLAERHVNRTE